MKNQNKFIYIKISSQNLCQILQKIGDSGKAPMEIMYNNATPGNHTLKSTKNNIIDLAMAMAGFLAFAIMMYFQYWTTIDYPLNTGGKPAHPVLSFIPVSFEASMLLSVVAGLISYMIFNRINKRKLESFEKKLGQDESGLIISSEDWEIIRNSIQETDYAIVK